MNWNFELLTPLILAVLVFVDVKNTLTAFRIQRKGIRTQGTVVSSHTFRNSTTYTISFTTLTGERIEGTSVGWRLMQTEYFPEEDLIIVYDTDRPSDFMLEDEFGKPDIYLRTTILLLVFYYLSWKLIHVRH